MGLTTVSNVSNIEEKLKELEDCICLLKERVNTLELENYNLKHPEDVLNLEDSSWDNIRAKRNYLLQSTDWTMTSGATLDQAQWSAYRQILRDLPQTYINFEDVVWPVLPSVSGPNTIEK